MGDFNSFGGFWDTLYINTDIIGIYPFKCRVQYETIFAATDANQFLNRTNGQNDVLDIVPKTTFTLLRSEIMPVEFTFVYTTPLYFFNLFTSTNVNQNHFE